MTPPPAATAAARAGSTRRLSGRPGSRIPRRVSGPVRPRAERLAGGGLALPRIDLRIPRPSRQTLVDAAARVQGLLRGRGLIVVLAGALLGLVFLQVSLLKLNTQISQNVDRAQALERDNAGKRSIISKLDAGRRIQDVAGQLGMVMPGPGAVCYLSASRAGACSGGDPAAAASAVDPAAESSQAAPAAATGVAAVPAPATGAVDPAATTPAATQAPATQTPATTQQTAPVTQQQTPAQTPAAAQPQAQAPAQAPAAAPQQTAAPTDQTGATGGIAAGVGG